MKQKLKVSVIVPTFNEEDQIEACLEALTDLQDIHEIIVVDNNSSDQTVQIVKSFPQVRLMHETDQGQVFARRTGFNAATGDVVATIDADTQVRQNWLKTILSGFEDESVGAVSAYNGLHDESAGVLDSLAHQIFNWFEFSVSRFIAGHGFLYGSNMAMRSEVWRSISGDLRMTQAVWEDFQMAILVNDQGHKIATIPVVSANVSARRFRDYSLKHIAWYVSGYIRTLRLYERRGPLLRAYLAYVFQMPVIAGLHGFLATKKLAVDTAHMLAMRLEVELARYR